MNIPASLFVALTLAAPAGCALAPGQAGVPCRFDDTACAKQALIGHAARKLDFWRPALARPLEQRIGAAPPELLEYVSLDNIFQGVADRPRAATLTPEFLKDVQDAFAEIPPGVKRLLPARLAGIYFIEDFGGTGYTDEIGDPGSKPAAGFIVLDPKVLAARPANAWATWKENTPFSPAPGFRLEAEIESTAQDNRKNAIQYILLHELGHVVSINNRIHPSWNDEAGDISPTAGYPFFELSWGVSDDRKSYVTRFDAAFPKRREVVYYFGAKLAAGEMAAVYDRLENTNFATLYAATNPFDDFAESFVSYVHTVVMKRPFEIRIRQDGKLAKVFGSCWTQPRCAEKRKILDRLLDQP